MRRYLQKTLRRLVVGKVDKCRRVNRDALERLQEHKREEAAELESDAKETRTEGQAISI